MDNAQWEHKVVAKCICYFPVQTSSTMDFMMIPNLKVECPFRSNILKLRESGEIKSKSNTCQWIRRIEDKSGKLPA